MILFSEMVQNHAGKIYTFLPGKVCSVLLVIWSFQVETSYFQMTIKCDYYMCNDICERCLKETAFLTYNFFGVTKINLQ